ncbi:MAG: hypothetical protein GKR89_31170 [Candidatus Latescibacteria bacterium]|nr:hypothetical protein [Candidatus Latescibacterota bacterium]
MNTTSDKPKRRSLRRFMGDEKPDNGHGTEEGRPSVPQGHVGEVVESSTTELVAEACQLHAAPSFGRFVRVEADMTVVGIVFNVFTHSIEPNRRPTAYGKTERELRLEQPQIFELLRTEFQALVIGYVDENQPVPILPPQPAHIHSFVYPCSDDQVRAFTRTDDYLRSILNTSKIPTDELLVAALRAALKAHSHDRDYLVRMGKEVSRLLKDDYDRLSSIIRRIVQ